MVIPPRFFCCHYRVEMPKLRLITTVLLVVLLSIPVAAFAFKRGEQLPELVGTTLGGKTFNISSFKGQPIVLKVGTTWCPTCGQQDNEIEAIRGFMIDNGIRFIEVFIQERPQTIRNYLDKANHKRPDIVVIDQGTIADKLNIYLIPRLILIDKNLTVYRDSDPLPRDLLKQELKNMQKVP